KDTLGRNVGKVFKFKDFPKIEILEGSDLITKKDIRLVY
ncbi:uncharacterized protein METZ01_LOCUS467981, partial [marine metagenome]